MVLRLLTSHTCLELSHSQHVPLLKYVDSRGSFKKATHILPCRSLLNPFPQMKGAILCFPFLHLAWVTPCGKIRKDRCTCLSLWEWVGNGDRAVPLWFLHTRSTTTRHGVGRWEDL